MAYLPVLSRVVRTRVANRSGEGLGARDLGNVGRSSKPGSDDLEGRSIGRGKRARQDDGDSTYEVGRGQLARFLAGAFDHDLPDPLAFVVH